MTLDEYQEKAESTFLGKQIKEALNHPLSGLVYLGLKLSGEAGEVGEKIGKLLRDKGGGLAQDDRAAIVKELGDVLWYVAVMADELNVPLSHVARVNLEKLAKRKALGMIGGNGDDREERDFDRDEL